MTEDIAKEVHELDRRLTVVETTQPMLQDLMERSVASNEKLGETLHEMQTSMALMNGKMDAQAEAFEDLKKDMEVSAKKAEKNLQAVAERVDNIEDKGSFDIYTYIKTKLPWIIVLVSAGAMALSDKIKI